MEGRDPTPSPNEAILRRIKGFVRSLVVDLSSNRFPSFALDRYRSYCSNTLGDCICSSDLPCGKEIISLGRNACRLQILLRVLLIIQQLLLENKHGSKRDIYYMEPSVFTEQGVVDQAINEICILLKCSHHHLNVVPVGKGLVMGWLRFVEAGRRISCITNLNTAYMIPVCVEEVGDIVSVAQYILVVEKETVFQRLANDKFCERNHCIVITGRGYPDVPTRRFLQLLVRKLHLPAYCLVDFDPYGFDILSTYRFGSMQMAYDAKLMRVSELRWLGVFPSDFKEYQLPDRCLLSLTTGGKILILFPQQRKDGTFCRSVVLELVHDPGSVCLPRLYPILDKKKAEAILSRCYLRQEAPKWRLEMEIMLHGGVKFEIEALSASSLSFLSECYIPSKIQKGGHI